MSNDPDVVVVGAGIAGGALAGVLGRQGIDVLVLERTEEHVDRVRGEYMQIWGVADAQATGLYEVLIDGAEANVIERLRRPSDLVPPDESEAQVIEMNVLPGVDGALGVSHPAACDALDANAIDAGARLVRGVTAVTVVAGDPSTVTYTVDGVEQTVRPRLVVAADGRESTVRKQLGFELQATTPFIMGAGLRVCGVDSWPAEDCVIGSNAGWEYLAFPQRDGFARLYLMYEIEHKQKLAGANKTEAFLDAFRVESFPPSEVFAAATPAGPCGAFPMNDSWVDEPVGPGVVLIGDAGGWSDPLIGQGLSVAMRDVRFVSEALLAGDDWSPTAFEAYVDERRERMRRLRYTAYVIAKVSCDSQPGGVERRRALNDRLNADSELFFVQATALIGPHNAPAAPFSRDAMKELFGDDDLPAGLNSGISTTRPTAARDSMYACAAAASDSGNVRSTSTLSRPAATSSMWRWIISRTRGVAISAPRNTPVSDAFRPMSGDTSMATRSRPALPTVMARPRYATARSEPCNVEPPTESTTRSTPRPSVRRRASSAASFSL